MRSSSRPSRPSRPSRQSRPSQPLHAQIYSPPASIRELKPLWNAIQLHAAQLRRYNIQCITSVSEPSNPPEIPFSHPLAPNSTPLAHTPSNVYTYTCTAPNMGDWRIHVHGVRQRQSLIHSASTPAAATSTHTATATSTHTATTDPIAIPVARMFIWLSIVHSQIHSRDAPTPRHCLSHGLNVHIYPYRRAKRFPMDATQDQVLGPAHVNTAYTYSCPAKGEIIIYRVEELFKVFIHETMHAAGYDFSHMDARHTTITTLYPGQPIATFESYTEFWARIWSLLFVQYTTSSRWNPQSIERRIAWEQMFATEQMVRILKYNQLTYSNLISGSGIQNQYREQTNVLAYYAVTAAMLTSFCSTIKWCSAQSRLYGHGLHAPPLYIFYASIDNIRHFHRFLRECIHLPLFIAHVTQTERRVRAWAGRTLRMTSPYNDIDTTQFVR